MFYRMLALKYFAHIQVIRSTTGREDSLWYAIVYSDSDLNTLNIIALATILHRLQHCILHDVFPVR